MSEKPRLFVVVVGGHIAGAHVELHDTRFVIGASIEACYADLKAQWWGEPESLHLDAWGPLEWADGWRIDIADEPRASEEKLFFVNLGGYDPQRFDELHRNSFLVASNWRAAKTRAIEAVSDWQSPHKDNVFEVDQVIDVAAAAGGRIRLARDPAMRKFEFEARYVPIGKM